MTNKDMTFQQECKGLVVTAIERAKVQKGIRWEEKQAQEFLVISIANLRVVKSPTVAIALCNCDYVPNFETYKEEAWTECKGSSLQDAFYLAYVVECTKLLKEASKNRVEENQLSLV